MTTILSVLIALLAIGAAAYYFRGQVKPSIEQQYQYAQQRGAEVTESIKKAAERAQQKGQEGYERMKGASEETTTTQRHEDLGSRIREGMDTIQEELQKAKKYAKEKVGRA